MFDPQKMEVFCKNTECGFPDYRRMEFRGQTIIDGWKYFKLRLAEKMIGIEDDPSLMVGTYYMFACPVCGTEKVFINRMGMVFELQAPPQVDIGS